jgi:hypothetical protein
MADLNDLGGKISAALTGAVKATNVSFGELTLVIELNDIPRVLNSVSRS